MHEESAEAIDNFKKVPVGVGSAVAAARTPLPYFKLIPRGPSVPNGTCLHENVEAHQFQGWYPGGGVLMPPDSHSQTYRGPRADIPRTLALARVVRWMWQRHKAAGQKVTNKQLELLPDDVLQAAIDEADRARDARRKR